MNECFLIGKIISEIKFDFVIGKEEYFSKKENISVVRFCLELLDKNKICVIGYNSIADFCYQKLKTNDYILIDGFFNTKGNVEMKNVDIYKEF